MASSGRSWDYLCKLIIIGESGTGKTCVANRYVDGEFSNNFFSTIGLDYKLRTIHHRGLRVKLQVFDTAGQCRFRSMCRQYYRACHGCFLVYDVTDRKSFEQIEAWMDLLRQNTPEEARKLVPILVGNKVDCLDKDGQHLVKAVHTDEVMALAKKLGCRWFEVSAKENVGIDALFETLVEGMLEMMGASPASPAAPVTSVPVDLTSPSKKKPASSTCCA